MHTLNTPSVPATHSTLSSEPMSEPCSLCLPMHSSCDQTTCPSLLLFGKEGNAKSKASLNGEYWIIATSLLALEESASDGCLVCATLYTGIMTERMCHELREIAEVRVARDGHVGVVNLECLAWMTDLSFYTIRDSGKKYTHAWLLLGTASKLESYSQDCRQTTAVQGVSNPG